MLTSSISSELNTTAYSTSTDTAATGTDELDKNAFLQLLVTQLQNQDPLNPMENAEFVAQLAQFSTLEGITNLNTTMDEVSTGITTIGNYSATDLIGKSVKVSGDSISYSGEPVTMGYSLASDSTSVTVNVYDSNGTIVKSFEAQNLSAGEYQIEWDGTSNDGEKLDSGSYNFTVTATASDGTTVSSERYVLDEVQSVMYDSGVTKLLVGGVYMTLDEVTSIY